MKLQELIKNLMDSKKATRSELATLMSVHPDTLTKIKNGKYNLSEEKAEAYLNTILEAYPEEQPEEQPQPKDEAGLVEGKNSTTVEYLVNAYGFKPQKVRRILRKLFGEEGHEKGKTWTLTTEQFSKLEAELLGKGGEVK